MRRSTTWWRSWQRSTIAVDRVPPHRAGILETGLAGALHLVAEPLLERLLAGADGRVELVGDLDERAAGVLHDRGGLRPRRLRPVDVRVEQLGVRDPAGAGLGPPQLVGEGLQHLRGRGGPGHEAREVGPGEGHGSLDRSVETRRYGRVRRG